MKTPFASPFAQLSHTFRGLSQPFAKLSHTFRTRLTFRTPFAHLSQLASMKNTICLTNPPHASQMVPKHAKFNQIRILTLGNDFGIHPGLFLSSQKSFEHGDLLFFTTFGYFEAKNANFNKIFGVVGLCSSDSHLPFPVPFMFMNPRNGSVTIGMIKTVSRRCAVKENQKNAIFSHFCGVFGQKGHFFHFFNT